MKIENLTKLVPLISVLLIVSGYIKISLYYSYFDIDISAFITTSEVLMLFMDDILFYLICTTGSFATILFFNLNLRFKDNSDQTASSFGEIPIFIALYIFAVVIIEKVSITTSTKVFYLLIVSILPYFYAFIFRREKRYNQELFIVTLFIILPFIAANRDLYATTNNYAFSKTRLTTKTSKIICDSTYFYVGQTRDFVFLYNSRLSRTDVIRMSEVKSLSFSR